MAGRGGGRVINETSIVSLPLIIAVTSGPSGIQDILLQKHEISEISTAVNNYDSFYIFLIWFKIQTWPTVYRPT